MITPLQALMCYDAGMAALNQDYEVSSDARTSVMKSGTMCRTAITQKMVEMLKRIITKMTNLFDRAFAS